MTGAALASWRHDWPRIATVAVILLMAGGSAWLTFERARGGAGYSMDHVNATLLSLGGLYGPAATQIIAYAVVEARREGPVSVDRPLATWLAIVMLAIVTIVFTVPLVLLLSMNPDFLDIAAVRKTLGTFVPVGGSLAVGAIAVVFHRSR